LQAYNSIIPLISAEAQIMAIITAPLADCDCDKAQDHIMYMLVHINGCVGAKAPHSIILNVGIRRLQIMPRRINAFLLM
jgi:hypothetical protein